MADIGGVVTSSHNTTFTIPSNSVTHTVLTITGRTIRAEIEIDASAWTTNKTITLLNSPDNDISNATRIFYKIWSTNFDESDFDDGVRSLPFIIDSGYPYKFITIRSNPSEPQPVETPIYWVEVRQ